jgi:hypothetical protein
MIERLQEQYPDVESQLFVGKYNQQKKVNTFSFENKILLRIQLDTVYQENEIDEEQVYDTSSMVITLKDKQIRRKQSSSWKQLLCCGIDFFANLIL